MYEQLGSETQPLARPALARRPEARPAPETATHYYEFHDLHGQVRARVTVEMETTPTRLEVSEAPGLEPYAGQRLRSCILEHPDTGATVELLDQFNPHHVPVIVDSTIEQCGWELDPEIIIIPPLRSPREVAMLLHELRHAAQFRDPKLEALLVNFYEPENILTGKQTPETLQALLGSLLPKFAVHEQIEREQLARLPAQLLERDAERGCLRAFDKIFSQSEIDLFYTFRWEPPNLPDTPQLRAHEEEYRKGLGAGGEAFIDYAFGKKPVDISVYSEVRRYLSSCGAFDNKLLEKLGEDFDLEERTQMAKAA